MAFEDGATPPDRLSYTLWEFASPALFALLGPYLKPPAELSVE